MKRLSIVALALLSGCGPQGQAVTATIPRPAPDEATPTGIAYLCDGSKEVSVVYAKNRASVTMADKTWRFAHWARNAVTGELLVTAETVCVLFDFTTRKAASLPPDIRAKIAALMAG